MTRRRVFTVAVAGPRRPRRRRDRPARRRLRRRADLPPRQGALGGGRPDRRLRRGHLPPGRLHRDRGDRRRRQDHRLRAQGLEGARRGPEPVRRRLQPLRPPRLPGPLRRGRRQLHLPLPRRRLRLPGQADRRPAGAPARPFQTRVRDGQVELGPRYSVTSQLEPVRARDPGEFTGGIWEYLYPPRPSTFPPPIGLRSTMKLDSLDPRTAAQTGQARRRATAPRARPRPT